MITLIAAVAKNGAIGYQNKLLYWLPNDLKRFKTLTSGHTIVMGRKTFESLPKGALPNRRNLVLTHNADFSAPGVEAFPSLLSALAACGNDEDIYVIGGASVYAEALPAADRLCLTFVDDTPEAADAFFPTINVNQWQAAAREDHEPDDRHAYPYSFVDYIRC